MTKSPRKNVPDVGIELRAAWMPSERASDRATAPGNWEMCPKDVDGIANSGDPDQTAWSGSTLFAQTYLSENLGTIWYITNGSDQTGLVWSLIPLAKSC